MKRRLKFLFVGFWLLLSLFVIPDYNVQADAEYFTIAVIPDTQNYSKTYPSIFDLQTQWIADNANSQNIVFVAHLGDLVDDYNSDLEWQRAQHSMSIIRDTGIPYSVIPGNHDLNGTEGDLTYFDAYFPSSDFSGYSWYGGNYPENSNASNYALFSALGQDFIVLNLVCSKTLLNNTIAWANAVLEQYPQRRALIITHGYIDTSGNYIDSNGVSGIETWNNIVKLHSNVIAVLCGHYYGEFYNTSTGLQGNKIYNLLSDFQYAPHGGNGWLRLYKFYPELNKITAVTYSPYLDQYNNSQYDHFDLSLKMSPLNLGSSQDWYLDSSGNMQKTFGAQSGQVMVNGSKLWMSSEPAAASGVIFPRNTWTVQLNTSGWSGNCSVQIGETNGTGFNASGATVTGRPVENGLLSLKITSPVSVQPGYRLALLISGSGTMITDGSSFLMSPDDDPGYPLPELSSAVLLCLAIVGLSVYLMVKRPKRVTFTI